ncbi:MAG: hypothetical protein KC486_25340 [Myxococcales bacterium]|nr:hypothetical protein [Myxococcales bacterium]
MRDPARIDPILETLAEAWRLDPDLRLGQLLVNVVRPATPCPELFSLEDRQLRRRLERWITERRRRG